MKKKIIVIAILLFIGIHSNAQSNIDLPKNPKTGECYLRCNTSKGETTEWKKINCKIAKDFTNKEEIIKIQYKLINLGYKVEATGLLDNETIDSYIHFKKNEKTIMKNLRRKEKK